MVGGAVADFLRVIRRLVWFHIGVAGVVTLALWMETGNAANCGDLRPTRESFSAACEVMREQAQNDPNTFSYQTGSCDAGGVAGFGVVPACGRGWSGSPAHFWIGFTGTCPNGDAGPNIEDSLGPGESMPGSHCNGPCKIQNDACTSVGPLPDGSTSIVCQTSYTGETCIPGGSAPEPEVDEPGTCNSGAEVNGQCVDIDDFDSDGSSQNGEPNICLGGRDLCNETPPNPNHSADCSVGSNGAICVGNPNEPGSAPAPPSPPYPPGQDPDWSGTSNGGGGPTPVDIYGPPETGDAGPPDENGNCPAGTTNNGGMCQCPNNQTWNGTNCHGDDGNGEDGVCDETVPDDPDCQDGERTAEYGTCGETPPACSGDEIDCSILRQTWATRCALTGSDAPPEVDLEEDPLQQYGGAESFFETVGGDDGNGPNGLDYSGFLSGGSCPAAPMLPAFRGQSLVIPPVWCDLGWVYYIILGIATFIAARIVMGNND